MAYASNVAAMAATATRRAPVITAMRAATEGAGPRHLRKVADWNERESKRGRTTAVASARMRHQARELRRVANEMEAAL